MGRLIPESSAPELPFVAAAFAKGRTGAAQDELPACVLRRLRGQLFTGAPFTPTRNKLSFRDNLPQLLQARPISRVTLLN